MKKVVLTLSLFTLIACNEDVYQDIDQQNNGLEAASNPASDNGSGGNTPFTAAPGYDSPWNRMFVSIPLNTSATQVPYRFENQTGDWGSPYLLTLRVTPYVGLAYYDGTSGSNYYGTILDPTNYPNLYPTSGGSKIGHFIPAAPIVLDGTGLTPGSVVIEIQSSGDHCPVFPNTHNASLNPNTERFDLPNGGSPTLVTWQEEQLLSQYGKVFFYFCEAIDPVTNTIVWSRYIMPDCNPTVPPGYWNSSISVNIPGVGPTVPLYYNINPNPGSEELVLDIRAVFPSPPPFPQYGSYYTFPFNGQTMFVEIKTDPAKMYVKLDNL